MTKNTSVSLSEHFDRFVARQVESGKFGSASEVIRAGLRLLEEREARLEALRQALVEGEQSGPATPFQIGEIIGAAKREAGRTRGRARSR